MRLLDSAIINVQVLDYLNYPSVLLLKYNLNINKATQFFCIFLLSKMTRIHLSTVE